MLKKLIGTLGLLAIMIWFGICSAGYTLSFFGLFDTGWFGEEWLIQHPIFDLSLLILVLIGMYRVMSFIFDLVGIVGDEPLKGEL